jgi:hypothetical protein
VCRFIGDQDWAPDDRLLLILEGDTSDESAIENLDKMYHDILMHSIIRDRSPREQSKLCDRFRKVVGPIVNLFDPLSYVSLAKLLSIKKIRD